LERELRRVLSVSYGFTRQGKLKMKPEEYSAFEKVEVAKYRN
jgi:hypothetical protein